MRKGLLSLVMLGLSSLLSGQSTTAAPVWTNNYNGASNSIDSAEDIVVDSSGNAYVTGNSYVSPYNYDIVTIKYSPTGKQLWLQRYNGPSNRSDFASSLALDKSGNLYVTGQSEEDYVTLKYSSTGSQLWVRRYNGPINGGDKAADVAVDSAGNIYVTGGSAGLDDYSLSYDYVTVKYSSTGSQLWARRYNGLGKDYDDSASALAVDSAGSVYVTGKSNVNFPDDDLPADSNYATIKYAANGTQLWVQRYRGSHPVNAPSDLSLDSLGNVYVTGSSGNGFGPANCVTIKYSSTGTQLWTQRYGPEYDSVTEAISLAVDGAGNAYVTGYDYSSSTGYDYVTIKYSPSSKQL